MAYFCQRDLNTFSKKIDLICAAYPNWSPFNGERSRLYIELKDYLELQSIKDLMLEYEWLEVCCRVLYGKTITQHLVIQLQPAAELVQTVAMQIQFVTERLLLRSTKSYGIEYYPDTNQISYALPEFQFIFSEHCGFLFDLNRDAESTIRDLRKLNHSTLTSLQEQALASAKELLQNEIEPLILILTS